MKGMKKSEKFFNQLLHYVLTFLQCFTSSSSHLNTTGPPSSDSKYLFYLSCSFPSADITILPKNPNNVPMYA
jgi:hypothetical protein